MRNLIIIPFYCQAEIDRYCRIAAHLRRMPRQTVASEFLIAASRHAPSTDRLTSAFSRVADVSEYRCRVDERGYPRGPTRMFWETLGYINERCRGSGGFSLWLESDMVPVKADWIDRLSSLWQAQPDCLVMGLRVPVLYRRRFLRRPKASQEHINGGACYAHDLVERLPAAALEGELFDVDIFPHLKRSGGFQDVAAFAFSTVSTIAYDILDPRRVVLHGWKQDKDRFVREAVRVAKSPVSARSRHQEIHPAEPCCEFGLRRHDGYHCPLHSRLPRAGDARCA